MNDQQKIDVIKKVENYLTGKGIETNRFELKREWHKFKFKQENGVESDKNEFLKDVCALANSYGFDDSYLIFGVSEERSLHPSKIEDSGLSQADIASIVSSNIDRPITIDFDYITVQGTQLSIIHVPASKFKPHFVLNYVSKNNNPSKNVAFIRSGSSIKVAGRADFDQMYMERKDLTIDRKLECSFNRSDIEFRYYETHGIETPIEITVENIGTRPLRIMRFNLEIIHPPYRAIEDGNQMMFTSMTKNAGEPWLELNPSEIETKTIPFFNPNVTRDESPRIVAFLNTIENII